MEEIIKELQEAIKLIAKQNADLETKIIALTSVIEKKQPEWMEDYNKVLEYLQEKLNQHNLFKD